MTPAWTISPRGTGTSHIARVAELFDLVVTPCPDVHFGRDLTAGYAWRVENATDRNVFGHLAALQGWRADLDAAKDAATTGLRDVLFGALVELNVTFTEDAPPAPPASDDRTAADVVAQIEDVRAPEPPASLVDVLAARIRDGLRRVVREAAMTFESVG